MIHAARKLDDLKVPRPGFDLAQVVGSGGGRRATRDGFRTDQRLSIRSVFPYVASCDRHALSMWRLRNYFTDFGEIMTKLNLPIDFIGSSGDFARGVYGAVWVESEQAGDCLAGGSAECLRDCGGETRDFRRDGSAGMGRVFSARYSGLIHARRAEAEQADIRIDTLAVSRREAEEKIRRDVRPMTEISA